LNDIVRPEGQAGSGSTLKVSPNPTLTPNMVALPEIVNAPFHCTISLLGVPIPKPMSRATHPSPVSIGPVSYPAINNEPEIPKRS